MDPLITDYKMGILLYYLIKWAAHFFTIGNGEQWLFLREGRRFYQWPFYPFFRFALFNIPQPQSIHSTLNGHVAHGFSLGLTGVKVTAVLPVQS